MSNLRALDLEVRRLEAIPSDAVAAGKLAAQGLAAHQLIESCKVDPLPRAPFGLGLLPTDAACGRVADAALYLWLAGHRPPPPSPTVQDTG